SAANPHTCCEELPAAAPRAIDPQDRVASYASPPSSSLPAFTSSHFSRLPPQIEHSFSIPRLAIPPHEPAIGLRPMMTPMAMPNTTSTITRNTINQVIALLPHRTAHRRLRCFC